jgi:phenylalanyl-tRNA synthetase alpha chain
MNIVIESPEEKELKEKLAERKDPEAERMRRFLSMPDLSRKEGSPLREIVERVVAWPGFQGFDIIDVPEIVSTDITFDLFDFPADHPARSKSDTYYVDEENILRTHTTIMWYYYLQNEDVKRRMEKGEPVGAFSFGKVYRKDEIDSHHMNVFHQIDGWYLAPKDKKIITIEDLQEALSGFAKAVFGSDVGVRFNEDKFPYTHPSLEMEINKDGQWLEVAGAGVVKGSVLEKFGVDSSKWNGWAFGPGLERFAMISMELPDIRLLWSDDERVKSQLKLGQKFKEVSKFPPVVRDISFIVSKNFVLNDYFDLIRDVGGEMVENVELLDKYENAEKFGADKISYTFRVTYRHLEKTLTNEEVNTVHAKLEERTEKEFQASIRRV